MQRESERGSEDTEKKMVRVKSYHLKTRVKEHNLCFVGQYGGGVYIQIYQVTL